MHPYESPTREQAQPAPATPNSSCRGDRARNREANAVKVAIAKTGAKHKKKLDGPFLLLFSSSLPYPALSSFEASALSVVMVANVAIASISVPALNDSNQRARSVEVVEGETGA